MPFYLQTTERTRREVDRRGSRTTCGRVGGQESGGGIGTAKRWNWGWGPAESGGGQKNHGKTNVGGVRTTKRGWVTSSEKEGGNEKFLSECTGGRGLFNNQELLRSKHCNKIIHRKATIILL